MHKSIVIDGDMDRAVHDWLAANLGTVVGFRRHARWRTGWDVEVERDGQRKELYIRGPRGDNYVSPIDMAQEAAIHRAYLANGIPAPKPIAVIDEPDKRCARNSSKSSRDSTEFRWIIFQRSGWIFHRALTECHAISMPRPKRFLTR
jgi:hypothetical protein